MNRRAAIGFSCLLVLLGLTIVARTIQVGVGGGLGLLIGGLFVVAGALRLWMVTRT